MWDVSLDFRLGFSRLLYTVKRSFKWVSDFGGCSGLSISSIPKACLYYYIFSFVECQLLLMCSFDDMDVRTARISLTTSMKLHIDCINRY